MDELDEYTLTDDATVATSEDATATREDMYKYHTWSRTSVNHVDQFSIHEYSAISGEEAERYYQQYPEHFIDDIGNIVTETNAEALNFSVVTVDNATGEQSTVQLRIDLETMDLTELVNSIRTNTAPSYIDKGGYGSDSVSNKTVLWNLQWLKLISRSMDSGTVTVVVGSQTLRTAWLF